MKVSRKMRAGAVEAGRAALTGTLCVMLCAPQMFADGIPSAPHKGALTPQQRALHALNRFSFGPRPDDLRAVEAMGVDAWFERQLHPDTIDDSAFEREMEQFPATRLSTAELVERFPGPQIVKRMEQRGETPETVTNDPVERAIYADAMARSKFAAKLQAQGKTPAEVMANPTAMQEMMNEDEGPARSAGSAQDMQAGQEGMAAGATPGDAAKGKGKARPGATSTLTREDIEAMLDMAPNERFAHIIALSPADAFRFGQVASRRPEQVMRGFTPAQKEAVRALGNPVRVVAGEALETRLLRDVESQRQLQAVMTDFWLNHFSVFVRKNQIEPYLLNAYQRDTVLPNALGNFEQLLVATAESPAMLVYLDNWQSVGPDSPAATAVKRAKQFRPNAPLLKQAPQGINENYARELMELHTVGVNGGYTQKDVIEVAKCFTGWTIERPYAGGSLGFQFDERRHEGGSKTVMGVVIPEGGMQEGLTVLHLLATSPRTAHFVSEKLAVRFVSDNPPPALVDRMAATFTRSNGDIKAVLTTLFHSPEFWTPSVYRAKVKTPLEFVASALRAADVHVADPGTLVVALDRLGMPVYGMQTPNGYSWQSEDWVSTGALVNRMNFALLLSGDRIKGTTPDWPRVLGGDAEPTPATEKRLETLLLGESAGVHTRETVLAQFSQPGVQQAAAKNFSLAESDDEGNAMEPMRKGGDTKGKKTGANYFRPQAANFTLNADQPESPLDAMAGLLLGSPDFQRR